MSLPDSEPLGQLSDLDCGQGCVNGAGCGKEEAVILGFGSLLQKAAVRAPDTGQGHRKGRGWNLEARLHRIHGTWNPSCSLEPSVAPNALRRCRNRHPLRPPRTSGRGKLHCGPVYPLGTESTTRPLTLLVVVTTEQKT